MICRDAERLIDTFFDGELDGRLMREAALHVTRCRRCEGEIQDRERVHDLLKSAVDDEVTGIDLSSIWSGIEPAIDRERRGRKVLSWRLAAASARLGGVLWGGRAARGDWSGRAARDDWGGRGARGDYDTGDRDERSGRWIAPQLAGWAVLAASLVLAVSLATREGSSPRPAGTGGARDRVAASAPVRNEVTASAMPTQPTMRMARVGGPADDSMVRPVAARTRRRGGQVQIESVDSRAGAMAMWSVPANDTAVIWVGNADPRLRQPR